MTIPAWRVLFALSGLLILAGGPRHPLGTMAEMLAHPDWVPSHALMLAGFTAMTAGLWRLRAASVLPSRSHWWSTLALAGAGLQTLEMLLHTLAYVDHGHLVAGQSTPILSTHLFLSVTMYPVFAVTLIGFILASVRDRAIGSPWIAWIGIIGAAGHGLSAPLVVGLGMVAARVLFPLLVGVGVWLLLAAVWPTPRLAPAAEV